MLLLAACGGAGAPAGPPSVSRVAVASPAAAASLPPQPSSSSQPNAGLKTIHIGTIATISQSPLLIAQKRGYFASAGMDAEVTPLKSGVDAIPLLATGQIDVGTGVSPSVAWFNALQRGLTIKAVAPNAVDSADRPWAGGLAIAAKQATPVASLRDLKTPVRIASTGPDTLPGGLTLLLARRDGVPESSLSFTTMGLADMVPALANGSIDVATLAEPFLTNGEKNGSLKRWVSYNDLAPNVAVSAVLYGKNFLQDRDAGARFMEAWLRGVRDYEDAIETGRDLAEIESIIGGPTNTPPAVFEQMSRSHTISWMPPDGSIDVKPWSTVVDVWKSHGLIPNDVQAEALVDSSFAAQASAKLGPYQARR